LEQRVRDHHVRLHSTEFAREPEVSQGQLSRYEQGSSEIGVAVLLRLVRKSGKTIEWLYAGRCDSAVFTSSTFWQTMPRSTRSLRFTKSTSLHCPSHYDPDSGRITGHQCTFNETVKSLSW